MPDENDELARQLQDWLAASPPLPPHLQAASDKITAKVGLYVWNWLEEHRAAQLYWEGDGDTCGISRDLLEALDETLIPFSIQGRYLQLGEWWFEITLIKEWDAYLARRLDSAPWEVECPM